MLFLPTTTKHAALFCFACLGMAISLSGCNETLSSHGRQVPDKPIPVGWTQHLSMASLLAEHSAVQTQEDLSLMLAKPWYSAIAVKSTKGKEGWLLHHCKDYFALNKPSLQAQQAQNNNAFLEFKVMCEATRLLSQAMPSRHSNIPNAPLDRTLPLKLPKPFSLITSQAELTRIQYNKNLIYWGDVNSIEKVEKKSPHQSIYYSDSGIHNLEILGRGDIDGDAWEDILIAVRDSLEGGNYFNLRLFVVTVKNQNQWQLVAQY